MARLALLLSLLALPALADAGAPDTPDAALPDASVGVGGAEMGQEGEDGMENGPCSLDRDCERGFVCSTGRCRYSGYRNATCEGCGGGAAAVVMLGAALTFSRRRRE